jgi:tetratricopeptide (TPR) repeat protein
VNVPDGHTTALLREALINHKSGNFSVALLQYRIILRRDAGNLTAWESLSCLLLTLERFEDCADACQKALAIEPESPIAKFNLASALNRLLDAGIKKENPSEIMSAVNQLIELEDSDPDDAAWKQSHFRLLLGDFEAGWQLYESRLRLPGFIGNKELLTIPRWDGKHFEGRTLLLHWEQGFGDTIMMLRYLEQVKSLGGKLLLFVQEPLTDIAGTCLGPDYVFGHPDGSPAFNIQLPLLSLPLVLNTGIDTIPSQTPYISVPARVPNKARIFSGLTKSQYSKKYGLVWAGRPTHEHDSERSVPPDLLRPLEAVEGVSWFCLQREAPETVPFPGAEPLGGLLETFADTAYALSQLDMVVTVDTAIAHLAGAMGIPVMLLAAFRPDWRWLLGRGDSPWYPSIKIYRQTEPGDWPTVIQRAAADLRGQGT